MTTNFDDDQLLQLLADESTRSSEYRRLIPDYYARVTESFRATWGDSFHFGLFNEADSQTEAVRSTELWLGAAAALEAGMRALDVGCGLGGPALTIAETTGAHVTGVDITPTHVEIAQQRAREARLTHLADFLMADGMNLPFEDSAFDAVYLSEAGCHMPDWNRFVAGCVRVLRPGGRFVGIDWGCSERGSSDRQGPLEMICQAHAIPRLRSQSEVRAGLEACRLRVELIEEASTDHQVLRNQTRLQVVRPTGLPASSSMTAWHLLAMGGRGIRAATLSGDFVLTRWCAVKA
jgi:SAM-dependent methyltransferase